MKIHFILILIFLTSCKKYLALTPPPTMITSATAFNSDATASAVMNGLYSEMMSSGTLYSSGYASLLPALSADEGYHYSSVTLEEFSSNNITQNNHSQIANAFWQPAYKHIYTCNLILENINKSAGLSDAVRKTLEGEARFVRAFVYFELVNLFGKVPLILETNYHNSSTQGRKTTEEIYTLIQSDLLKASELLGTQYNSGERIKPTRHAAFALLSRMYLYQKNYAKAIEYATQLISNNQFSLNTDLNEVFKKNSGEAIWQLKPVNPGYNTWESFTIVPATSASAPGFLMSSHLLNAFEATDKRKISWTKSRTFANETLTYPFKYKVAGQGSPVSEYYMIFRLAELYLIRAEARAYTNDLVGALSDLDIVRTRAGLAASIAITQGEILSAIEQERRTELFYEWGHRWFDLKRTGRATTVLSLLKPGWQSTDTLWPLPVAELNANPNLDQNPGY